MIINDATSLKQYIYESNKLTSVMTTNSTKLLASPTVATCRIQRYKAMHSAGSVHTCRHSEGGVVLIQAARGED